MSITRTARKLAQLLEQHDQKIVFAESCTGGLVAGTLSQIPGISQYLCGSMVTYRNATKQAYLGIPAQLLAKPGAVSAVVAQRMSEGVLQRTPEANFALSVTGHLGPQAPKSLDGVVFIGISVRNKKAIASAVRRFEYSATLNRVQRQRSAILDALRVAVDYLQTFTN
jgi:nicotinamide-nucleotide amidase